MVSLDVQILLLLIETGLIMPLFLIASILIVAIVNIISRRLGLILHYLAFPGVVLHKLCQAILYRITRIPVNDPPDKFSQVRNGCDESTINCSTIHSFTGGLIVSLAPLYLLSLALYSLLVFWTIVPMHELLKWYFAFCFFIGLPPSRTDYHLVVSPARQRPSQALLGLGLLCFPFLSAGGYLVLCSLFAIPFSLFFFGMSLVGGTLLAYLLWRKTYPYQNP